jgi:hypothetical protein
MANATGESESDAFRLDFDRRLTLQFARIWASIQFKKNVYHFTPVRESSGESRLNSPRHD